MMKRVFGLNMRKQIYQIYSLITGKDWQKYSDYLEQSQWWEYGRIRKFQWNRLKSILEHAYSNVPYYTEKFRKAGIKPDDIKNFDDIRKIPFLTKSDIHSKYNQLLAIDKKRKVEVCSTSGTTGNPRRIVVDYDACAQYRALARRNLRWYGIEILSRYGKIWGMPLAGKSFWQEKLKDYILNCIRLDIFDLSDSSLEEFYHRCKRLHPLYLYGYTSGIYRFAQYLEGKKGSAKELGLKIVVATSEVIYDFQRELIERVFCCKVVAEYGAVETGIIAYECPNGNLHITPENVYIEIVEGNDPVPLNVYGEVIITNLSNYAMPIIRYRLGDISALYNQRCPCGVNPGFPLLRPVLGRTVDLSHHEAIEIYYAIYYAMKGRIKAKAIKEYQLVKLNEKNYILRIVKGSQFNINTPTRISENICQALKGRIRVQIEHVDFIEREQSGKTRYLISREQRI